MSMSERAWWQAPGEDAFRGRVQAMTMTELEALTTEIGGVVSRLSHEVQAGSPDAEWLARARRALGHMTERRAIVNAQLQLHNVGRKTKKTIAKAAFVEKARALLNGGDVAGAVSLIVDWMNGEAEGQQG